MKRSLHRPNWSLAYTLVKKRKPKKFDDFTTSQLPTTPLHLTGWGKEMTETALDSGENEEGVGSCEVVCICVCIYIYLPIFIAFYPT
jgi:hypothetical protein